MRSVERISSSGSGESRNNSSTDGVSAPLGRWNQSGGRVPSFLLRVSLKSIKLSEDLIHREMSLPGDVLGEVERIDPDLLLLVVVQVGPGVATCSLLS